MRRAHLILALLSIAAVTGHASGPGIAARPVHPYGFTPSDRVFILPHILEKSGSIITTTNTFDHVVYLNYAGGQAGVPDGGGATVEFFYYDKATNAPMKGSLGTDVCNPCLYQLNSSNHKVAIKMDDLLSAGGQGGFNPLVKLGYGVFIVHGPDSMAVTGQSFILNSHTGPYDLALSGGNLIEMVHTGSVAKTYVIPHFTEKSGSISSKQYSYDSDLMMLYSGGIGPLANDGSDTVQVWLYDNSGAILTGTNGDVCNPCRYELNAANPHADLKMEDVMSAAGAFDASTVRLGFAVVAVTGPNADAVSLENYLLNSHTGPSDLSILNSDMPEVKDNAGDRFIAISHYAEKSGSINTTQYTNDNSIYATYVPGLDGVRTDAGGATLDLYLYTATGDLLLTQEGTEVCNPCTYELNSANRKFSRKLDDLITAKGTFPATVVSGFGLIHISGADPAGVSVSGITVNSHTSPYDVGMYRLPMSEQGTVADGSVRVYTLPHTLEKSGSIATTQYTFDHTITTTYIGGLGGASSGSGASLGLYLYDQTGNVMTNNGSDVCNPCTFPLDALSRRKVNIRIDDLITAKGAFDQMVKSGYGVLVTSGDVNNVNISSFIANSHTSAFDLEASGFVPPELPPQEPIFSVGHGWNLLSVPRLAVDMRKGTVFAGAASDAFAYNAGYSEKDSLENGIGYWLKYADPAQIVFSGSAVTRETIQVQPGWNLIGSLSSPILVSSIASDPPRIITSQFFGYNDGYASATVIMPGRGYWVKVSEAAQLYLSSGGMNADAGRINIVSTTEVPPAPPGRIGSNAASGLPVQTLLRQNYPNPFNPSTIIDYEVASAGKITLGVYDLLGREVARLFDGVSAAGNFSTTWNANNMPSGVYLCRMTTASGTVVRTMILAK